MAVYRVGLALRANLACLSADTMLLGQHAVLTLPQEGAAKPRPYLFYYFTFAQAVGRFAPLHLSTPS
jgi:hypothetical protein